MIDPKIQADMHFNGFETAIENQDLSAALEELQQALALDPARCPFPAEEYELTQVLAASNMDVELLCRHRASNAHLIFKAPRAAADNQVAFDENEFEDDDALASDELGEYPPIDEDALVDESAGSDDVESYAEAESDTAAEGDKAYDEETDETYGEEAYEADDEETEEPEYDPEQAAFLCDRGRDHRANGDLEQAFNDFSEAIYLDPDSTDAYNSRANIYFLARQFDEAIADYNEAIRINPDLAIAHLNRGLAYARKQDSAEALADASSAIQLDPTLAGAYYLRGTSHYRLDDATEAIRDLTQAIRLNSADPAVYNQRGLAYAKLGDYDRAIEDYDRALRLAPDLVVAHFHRASAYQLRGDPIRAIAEFSEVVQLDPKHAEAYYQRGVAYAAQGEYESAIADFTESYRLDPNNALAVFKRDEAVRAKKQAAKSSEANQLAADSTPAQPKGQEVITCPGCGKRLTSSELRRRGGRCRECKARLPTPSEKRASAPAPKKTKEEKPRRFPRRGWFAMGAGAVAFMILGGALWARMAHPAPSAQVSAYDLWWECAHESVAAANKYDGKLLQVTGVVHEVSPGDSARIVFREPFDAPPPVECHFDPSAGPSGIQVNQRLTVVGKCKCYGAPEQPIQLLSCRVVNVQ